MIFVANRIAGRDVLQADERADVTRVTRLDFLTVIGMHLEQPADALPLVIARIVDRLAFGDLTGVRTEKIKRPAYGSVQSLNASAANGALSSAERVSGCLLSGFVP